MNKWFTQAVASVVAGAALSLAACEKDEDRVTLTPDNPPTLSASVSSVVLTPGSSSKPAVTYTWTPVSSFSWSGAEHTYAPAVSYSFQIDKQGNNFASPVSLDAGAGPTTVFTFGGLNESLNKLGLTPGTATPLEVRLRANYAANSTLYSSPVALTATSYECKAPTADTWAIIGPAGVDWDTDVTMSYDCDLRAYTLTRALKAGDFKFRSNKAWVVEYGGGARDASGSAPLVAKGANISVPAAGTYTIILDLNKMTYTLTK